MTPSYTMADYDGLVFNPFGDDKPKRTKRRSKSKPYPTKTESDPFSGGSGLVFDPFGNSNENSSLKNDSVLVVDPLNGGLDGLVDAGKNIQSTVDVIKTINQNRKSVPTDPDHILSRAKRIKAEEKKKKDVQKARDYIMEQNAKKHKQWKESIYEKYGYIKGNEIIRNKSLSKTQRLKKFLRR